MQVNSWLMNRVDKNSPDAKQLILKSFLFLNPVVGSCCWILLLDPPITAVQYINVSLNSYSLILNLILTDSHNFLFGTETTEMILILTPPNLRWSSFIAWKSFLFSLYFYIICFGAHTIFASLCFILKVNALLVLLWSKRLSIYWNLILQGSFSFGLHSFVVKMGFNFKNTSTRILLQFLWEIFNSVVYKNLIKKFWSCFQWKNIFLLKVILLHLN